MIVVFEKRVNNFLDFQNGHYKISKNSYREKEAKVVY